jgi:dTDP-4-amino-4,6-dideoxygalactose transaminase
MKKRDAVWFYEITVPAKSKNTILKKIPAARHSFKPLSSFPMYGSRRGEPISLRLSQSLILLPAFPALTERGVKNICSLVNAQLP